MIKSRRMRWAGRVARMGKRRCTYRVLGGEPIEKDEMGWTCGTYGEGEGYMQGFGWGNLKEKATRK